MKIIDRIFAILSGLVALGIETGIVYYAVPAIWRQGSSSSFEIACILFMVMGWLAWWTIMFTVGHAHLLFTGDKP